MNEGFTDRFRRLREAAGLTKTALAKPRYTVSYVSQIESGRRHPAPAALAFFASRLGVTPAHLSTGTPDGLSDRVAYEVQVARETLRADGAADALEQASRALDEIERHSLTGLRGAALLVAADALQLLGRPREAIVRYEDALEDESMPERDRGLSTASLATAYRMVGDLSYSADLVESYLRPARPQPLDPAVVASLQNVLISIYFERGDMHRAERAAERAIAAVEMGVSPAARAQVLWSASRVLAEAGRWREALEHAERARSIIEGLQDQRRLGLVHSACAFVALEADPPNTRAARRHLDAAQRLLETVAVPGDMASLYSERSRLALLEGDHPEALEQADRALAEAGEAELARGRCLFLRGRALAELGRRSEALDALADAAMLFQKAGSRQQEASCWREIGELQLAGGQGESALESLRAGLSALDPRRSRA